MQNYLLNRIKWNTFLLLIVMSFHTGHTESLKTEKSQVSPLEELLIAFTTNPTVSLWSDVNQIKSISWSNIKPYIYIPPRHDENDRKKQISKKGKMLLLGFLNAQLPNGKIGDEADTITKNEGWSGVTLNSNSSETPYTQGVANISIVKFYPTQDHHKVLHDQLSNSFLIKTIANECVDDFETGIKFYEIVYKENHIFYAKISLDEEGSRYSPGSTYISFERIKPLEEIRKLKCKQNIK